LLGDVSNNEVAELNRVFRGDTGFHFVKGNKEPASIIAFNWVSLALLGAVCTGITVYAKVVKRYNVLWYVAGFLPLATYGFYNYVRQPNQEIENCYKYLLAKRAATCELEKNGNLLSQ
jgi:hypothetical protein